FVWETEHVAGTEKDEVTRTSPEDGESVKPDATITIYLATGLVEVPDVVGDQLDDAREAIPRGIQINTYTTPVSPDDHEPGGVLSQSQKGLLGWNETITLEIADEEPEPEPEPRPTDTEEPEPTDTATCTPREAEKASPGNGEGR